LGWDATKLRASFTKYFSDKAHVPVEPWPLIPADEGLLFTIAGMVPFKPYFTGEEKAPFPRATTIQRCFRMLDIELVGMTNRHNTFFEMLGNFSFGDYFKEEAIAYAWEFVTESLGLDKDRLWVTVHESDQDSIKIWKDTAKIPDDRIQVMGDDNFWKMGDTGPCGPCSEIYFDKGSRFGQDGGPKFGGEDRFVEIWNLVFMQYEKLADGKMLPLPKPSIDTGAGLERILALLEGVDSVFDTGLIKPIMDKAASLAKLSASGSKKEIINLRILADHARAMAFLISDGVFPSNEGRGYVLRRIIRRAVLRANHLGHGDLMTPELALYVTQLMKDDYPKLYDDSSLITKILSREEETFRRTLKSGANLLQQALNESQSILPGEIAFKLHDTYGFPIELTLEMVHESNKEVDLESFSSYMNAQREMARANRKQLAKNDETGHEVFERIQHDYGTTSSLWHNQTKSKGRVLEILPTARDDEYDLILDSTCFYPEGGGQVGDKGIIRRSGVTFEVTDTQMNQFFIVSHRGRFTGGIFDAGAEVDLEVNESLRDQTRRNHTATHLLHAALRQVLGSHVKQHGSLVAPDRLRFDFNHFAPLTLEEKIQIEDLVNSHIFANEPVSTYETGRDEAEAAGAIAFFGEKYGERVRVVKAGDFSTELCGGTHVRDLGMIGMFYIISETSIGANTRRIEATTAVNTLRELRTLDNTLQGITEKLNTSRDKILDSLEKLERSESVAKKTLEKLKSEKIQDEIKHLLTKSDQKSLITRVDNYLPEELRQIALMLSNGHSLDFVALIGASDNQKVSLVVSVKPDKGYDAKEIIAAVAPLISGGGGGSNSLAIAGGKDSGRIREALEILNSFLRPQADKTAK